MKNIEKLETKIEALQAKLEIEQEKECRRIEKECQWVIGKCLNLRENSFIKIIGIEKSSDSNALELECLLVYYGIEDLKATRIVIYNYEYVPLIELKQYMGKYSISNEKFDTLFYKAVSYLKGL